MIINQQELLVANDQSSLDIASEIERFQYWHYQFDLGGHRTPVAHPEYINRHAQRDKYFFRPVLEYFGGSLRGKRVLDLGCHSGFWTLKALEAGCDQVVAVEGRQENVEQATFVLRASGFDRTRYELLTSDVYDLRPRELGDFDIVLCLGLLYHTGRPIELFELASSMNSDVIVVDTALSPKSGACYEVRYESRTVPINTLEGNLVLCPTKLAVAATMREFGYRVGMLDVHFSDYRGCDDYRRGRRRAFLGAKRSILLHDGLRFGDIDDFATAPSR
jgi:2-polyprenyl-3-methyl-5-hydroxy-6-metoxy-1,4-benzoquinol methylase